MFSFAKMIRLLTLALCLCVFILALFANVYIINKSFLLAILSFFSALGVVFLFCFSIGVFTLKTQKMQKNINILDELPEAVVITDINGSILEANIQYKNLVRNSNVSPLTLFQEWNIPADQIYRLFHGARQGRLVREEVRVDQKIIPTMNSNNVLWLVLEAYRAVEKEHIVWRIIDVSNHRENQENYFRDLQEAVNHLDLAPVGFLSINALGNVIYMNATFSTFAGYDLSAFTPLKLNLIDLFISKNQNKISQFLVSKQNGSLTNVILDHNNQIVDLYVNWQFYGQDEAVARIVIIPNMSTKENLDDKSVVFNDYFDNNSIAMAVINHDALIVKTNKIFEQLIGTQHSYNSSLSSLIILKDRDRLERIIESLQEKATISQRFVKTFETALEKNENKYVTFYFSPLSQSSINNNAIVVSIVETTQMRVLEEQMLQSQKMQAVGQLAGGIAHDFNNVLTAIIMSCDLLLASHRTSDPSHPDLMNIKLNANRAASLVQQLLAFSRRQTLRPQIVDLPELLSSIMNMVSPALGTQIKVETTYTRDLWPVEVDKGSFDQVITNLVFNARDAMPNGGILSISTKNISSEQVASLPFQAIPEIDYVGIEVKDNGTGIPEDLKEKIFEPFFTTKEVGKGTGLGLSMVYGIIKQTNGYIFCTSELGHGTSFHILLPRYDESMNKKIETPHDEKETPVIDTKSVDLSGTATVLLVEDEDAVRMGGVRALQSRGYTVLEAGSGVEALEVLEEHNGNVDIVVSDVVMPEMDGPTLLSELRKTYPNIKFIFVSGYAKDAFAKNLPEDAEFGFLAKPFSLKELASAVKNMLSQ